MHESAHCLNCDAPLAGPFCAQCGQKDQHRIVPIRHLIRDLVHEIVSVDHHVFSTFWALLSRPGALTVEYLAGRRVRHLPPLRLYVLTSFFMFLALGALTPRWVALNRGTKGSTLTVVGGEASTVPPGAQETKRSRPQGEFERRMEAGAKRAASDPAGFMAHVIAVLPKVMFLLLPVFALMLKLLYARRKVLYAAHAIFALHLHTAAFLMFLATIGLGFVPGLRGWMVLALCLGLPAYGALAMRRVYGQSWFKTLVKGALLGACYVPLVLAGTVAALLWTLYQGG